MLTILWPLFLFSFTPDDDREDKAWIHNLERALYQILLDLRANTSACSIGDIRAIASSIHEVSRITVEYPNIAGEIEEME